MKTKNLFLLFMFCGLVSGSFAATAPMTRSGSSGRGIRAAVSADSLTTTTNTTASTDAVDTPTTDPVTDSTDEDTKTDDGIENKSSSFANIFGGKDGTVTETPLQKSIREQREKLGLAIPKSGTTTQAKTTVVSLQAKISDNTAVICDKALRSCMKQKCGDDSFSKCSLDSDTDWGMKVDSCRRDTKCNGEEFSAVSTEMKADRDQDATLSGFSNTVYCGKTYSNCIRNACGDDGYTKCIARGNKPEACNGFANGYSKCLSKSGGDSAIAKCANEYSKCQEMDSGLQSRTMDMFAGLRVGAEKNISTWEQSLYDLRDSMSNMCKTNQSMFDERSLKCVYTVDLYADKDGKQTQFASKKLNGDSSYTCNPDWFGIDITTFKENAYRLTRSQEGASSAMMGAGAGVAVGALTSGAIGRAVETKQAADAVKDAKKEQSQAQQPAAQPGPEKIQELPIEKIPQPVALTPAAPVAAEVAQKPIEKVETKLVASQGPETQIVKNDDADAAAKAAKVEADEQARRNASAAQAAATAAEAAAAKKAADEAAQKSAAEKAKADADAAAKKAADDKARAEADAAAKKAAEKAAAEKAKADAAAAEAAKKAAEKARKDALVKRLCPSGAKYNNDTDGITSMAGAYGWAQFDAGCIGASDYNYYNRNIPGFSKIPESRSVSISK